MRNTPVHCPTDARALCASDNSLPAAARALCDSVGSVGTSVGAFPRPSDSVGSVGTSVGAFPRPSYSRSATLEPPHSAPLKRAAPPLRLRGGNPGALRRKRELGDALMVKPRTSVCEATACNSKKQQMEGIGVRGRLESCMRLAREGHHEKDNR